MKVEKVREKDGKLELAVELSGKEVEKDMQQVAAREIVKKHYQVNHKDDDPVTFLKKHLGDSEAAFLFDEGIMRHRVPFALTAAEVDTIGEPVFKCLEHAQPGETFTFHIVCVPVPEFELSDYGPVAITVPSSDVKPDEVELEIQKMAQAAAVATTDETHDVVMKGDKIEIAMETTKDGERIRPLCAERREYNTGSFAMPDDFDNAIIGMKVGETKTFSFQGPELELDENRNVIMETYVSTVTVNRIISMQPPEIGDEWARTTQVGVKNLADLRKNVREKLEKEHEDEHARRSQLLASNELAKRLEGEIPDLIYGVAVKEARKSLDEKLKREKLSLDEYLEKEGIEKKQLDNMLLLQVRSQLTRQFALNAYAKHEGISIDDDDLKAFFESIAPGKAGLAMSDFRSEGRMYAARCAALRLKASKDLVERADVKLVGAAQRQ